RGPHRLHRQPDPEPVRGGPRHAVRLGAVVPALAHGPRAALRVPAPAPGVAGLSAVAESRRRSSPVLAAFSVLVYLFLYAPILVLVVFSFNAGRLTAEWQGFTLAWYAKLLRNPQILSALRNSLVVAFSSTVACTVLGTAAALAFHKHRFRKQAAFDALITVPIVVPEIVLA